MNPKDLLKSVRTILVIDWPRRELPDTLALAGFQVFVHGGPDPEDYSAHEVVDGKVQPRRTGRRPEHADLIYSHRPLSELPQIIATAKSLGAKAIWTQSGLSVGGAKDPKGCWLPEHEIASARNLIHSAGLHHIHHPDIAEAASQLRATA